MHQRLEPCPSCEGFVLDLAVFWLDFAKVILQELSLFLRFSPIMAKGTKSLKTGTLQCDELMKIFYDLYVWMIRIKILEKHGSFIETVKKKKNLI